MFRERLQLLRVMSWILLPLALFSPLAWLDSTLLFAKSDTLFYTSVLSLLSDALKQGIFFPRWVAQANMGFGSPVMMFYAPLASILTTIINLPFVALHLSINSQLMLGIYASQVVSGYTAWLWLRRTFSEKIAWMGSVLFVMLPYKFIYILLHANLGQLWALAFLPLWMMAAEDILKNEIRAIATYALAFAAVYYNHPLTVIAFGAVPVCYVLWFARGPQYLTRYIKLFIANLLGIGLCVLQAFPQHHYLGWVQAEKFLTGIFYWRNNFFHIDVMLCAYYAIIAAMLVYAFMRVPALKKLPVRDTVLFWSVNISVVLFMTQRQSAFVWEHISILQYLQFPAARLHAVALIAVTYLICVWLTYYKDLLPLAPLGFKRTSLAMLIAVFGIVTLSHIRDIYLAIAPPDTNSVNTIHSGRILPPYGYGETHWGCVDITKITADALEYPDSSPYRIEQGTANITINTWHPPEQIVFLANVTSETATMTLRQCYIPKWQAHDETGAALTLSPGKTRGLIELTLPKGAHAVSITMLDTPVEYYSCLVSILSLAVCALLLIIGKRTRPLSAA